MKASKRKNTKTPKVIKKKEFIEVAVVVVLEAEVVIQRDHTQIIIRTSQSIRRRATQKEVIKKKVKKQRKKKGKSLNKMRIATITNIIMDQELEKRELK